MNTLAFSPGHLNEPVDGDIVVAYQHHGLLAYQDHGSSDCGLLLLPGWCESRAVFAPLIEHLQLRWRILSVDLPGHGASPMPMRDFGFDEIAAATTEAIEQSGLQRVIPVTHSDAGWVAIELRRRLGARIPSLVLLDWLVLDPPAALQYLPGLEDPEHWQDTCDRLFLTWLGGSAPLRVTRHVVKDMGSYEASMWARAAREIDRAYRLWGNPLKVLEGLDPTVPTLHIYAQPADNGYLHAQQEFARRHAWFTVQRLEARTYFPSLEAPEQVATAIHDFIA